MRIGHASISENGTAKNGKAGDQTGKEVCIRDYYKKNWKYILRCIDPNKAEIMAAACESLCANKHVGYDQNGRNTLHKELQKINYDFINLSVDCECDCSSYMTVLAECAGIYPEYISGNAPTTSDMVAKFKATKMFKSIDFSEKVQLKRGDILVLPGTHTVMVLDDSPYINKKEYKYGIDVSSCQKLINWTKVKNAGIDFAILRSTKKNNSTDEYFEANLKGCIANRIDYSCYKYSYAKTEAEAIEEAKSVITLLGVRKMTVWLDLENKEQLQSIREVGINKIAEAFINTIQKAGFDVGIYCNLDWYNNVIDPKLKSKYKFWIARYGKNTGKLDEAYKPNKGEFGWQYTSKGRVDGITGDVDLDVI